MFIVTAILTAAFLTLVVVATRRMDAADLDLARRVGKARGVK